MSRATAKQRPGRDSGQAALEFAGWIAVLLIAALAAVQLGIAAYAMQQAGTAARAAARVASQGGDGQAAGQAAVSGWLDPQVSAPGGPGADQVTATATVPIPAVLPLFTLPSAVRTTTMPVTAPDPDE
ncbi:MULTISPECIES: TadE/TadG family type IV pilus assembly protein [Streptomyces]|uniref:Pilus assembly protein n=1 Tax=Streptomyces lichenis TaxID=2306967 RepID=A0ABT0IF16_9ACTN|nr:TadE/TadG family type IV pilus assembly protein [Streptomyces lichenis]MCK8679916.1 pilus assembly protein [Streptomyces lichenis]